MRVKVAEIVIKGDGANVMDLRSKIVGALEKGSERDKYDTQVKPKSKSIFGKLRDLTEG